MSSHQCVSTRPPDLVSDPGVSRPVVPESLVPVRSTPSTPVDRSLVARFEAALIARIGAQRHALWFVGNTAVVSAGRDLLVVVSNEAFQRWLEQTFGPVVRAATEEASDGKAAVRFVVDAELFVPSAKVPQLAVPAMTAPESKAQPQVKGKGKPSRTLFGEDLPPPPTPRAGKPKAMAEQHAPIQATTNLPTGPKNGRRWKSLSDFVVGSCNRVAHASALSVVDEPGDAANPLVFHGPVGTGKTHLLEGIYAGIRKKYPDTRPTFITAEDFTTRYVQSCRFDKQTAFRRQFRDCSALILDDLHFLATKPGSQKEFMQTLDALVAEGRQVVVTLDCHPRLAEELMPELVDRLLGGTAWPLQPPDDDTRLDILRAKAMSGPTVPESVLKYLARNLKGNVRELEGAMNGVRHFAKVTGRPVDQTLVREALGDLLRHTVRSVTIQDVDAAVCTVLRLGQGALQSKARNWAISHPRMLATFLARKHTAGTYGEISKHFGARTHSAAVAAEKRVRAWIQKNEKLSLGDRNWDVKDLIDRIERELLR
jgi:chromosomal replication initiator protein